MTSKKIRKRHIREVLDALHSIPEVERVIPISEDAVEVSGDD